MKGLRAIHGAGAEIQRVFLFTPHAGVRMQGFWQILSHVCKNEQALHTYTTGGWTIL